MEDCFWIWQITSSLLIFWTNYTSIHESENRKIWGTSKIHHKKLWEKWPREKLSPEKCVRKMSPGKLLPGKFSPRKSTARKIASGKLHPPRLHQFFFIQFINLNINNNFFILYFYIILVLFSCAYFFISGHRYLASKANCRKASLTLWGSHKTSTHKYNFLFFLWRKLSSNG